MIQVTDGLIGPIPVRPRARKRLKRYKPPKPPQIQKFMVEVKRGADDHESFPWWGPINDYETVIKELKEEGFRPIGVW